MTKKITLILFLIISIFIFNNTPKAEEQKNLVNIYFFHSNTCSHCKEENEFLNDLNKTYNNIKIYKYEIHDQNSQEILKKVEDIYEEKINSVPLTIIGNKIYTGFSDKSKIKFIKTIDYYSKYGYEDNLGQTLNLELPTYDINKKDISLDEFIDTYNNYSLFGLKTDTLDPSVISLLLGLARALNIISILGIVSVSLIIIKIKNQKTKSISQIFYIITSTILVFNNTIDNKIILNLAYFLIILLLIYGITKYIIGKKQYLPPVLVITISCIINLLINHFYSQNLRILENITKLHQLEGLNLLYYYNNYFLINFVMNIIMLYFISILINIFKKKEKI